MTKSLDTGSPSPPKSSPELILACPRIPSLIMHEPGAQPRLANLARTMLIWDSRPTVGLLPESLGSKKRSLVHLPIKAFR